MDEMFLVDRQMRAIAARTGTPYLSLVDLLCDALARGENVKISGFGTFVLRDKKERVGRNPKTGVEVPITPRRVMTFRASQLLKEKVAKG